MNKIDSQKLHNYLDSLGNACLWNVLLSQSKDLISQTSSIVEIKEFQSIVRNDAVPGAAYLLLTGEARLFLSRGSKQISFSKYKPGDIIGLSSIFTKLPIEEVSCSKTGTFLEIPESTLHSLFEADSNLRSWLDNNILPGEFVKIAEYFIGINPKLEECILSAKDCFKQYSSLYPATSAQSSSSRFLFELTGKGLNSINVEDVNSLSDFQVRRFFNIDKKSISKYIDSLVDEDSDLKQAPQESYEFEANNSFDRFRTTSVNNQSSNSLDSNSVIYAVGERDQATAIFKMLCKFLGLTFRADDISRKVKLMKSSDQGFSLSYFGKIAASLGLNVMLGDIEYKSLSRMHTPSLIYWDGVITMVTRATGRYLEIVNPVLGLVRLDLIANKSKLQSLKILCIQSVATSSSKNFNFGWFAPSLKKYSQPLLLVLATSFAIQAFTLVNPLLIQVIIDKVLTQRSTDTLQVLGFALLFVTLIEGLMTVFRGFLFNDITNKIDISLGSEVVAHLFKLPLNYFDKRPVGELGTRLAELEKIRNFVTGQALTSILDASFSLIYITVMIAYSPLLTLVGLSILPIQIGLTVFGAPLFRKQYRRSAEENARTQSHLIEAISGIQTVKAQSIELTSRWKWQGFYNNYIQRSFEKNMTGQVVNQLTMVLQKISQLLVLWVGAELVLAGEFSLGQLIAFRIISGYVTQPLLRLSTVWQSYQELKVSFERLSDIVDTKAETDDIGSSNIIMPKLKGEIEITDLSFTFDVNKPTVLNGIDMKIESGQFAAIVGLSGSGKSTLTKLISRLYKPSKGSVKIDGLDNCKVELTSLRSQMGIVPQDPLLFKGSVFDNIALSVDNPTSEMVVEAAKKACAHDFIMNLPDGYNTQVGEKGASLSGGQRQRIAIARTLIVNPKLLLLDEATSALDYDTEKRVCESLRSSLKGCTVIFVTHRLPTIKNADKIFLMHQGLIREQGRHEELMSNRSFYYALYKQQEAN